MKFEKHTNLPEDVKKRVAEKTGITEEALEKKAGTEIDETPAIEANYERASEYLSDILERIEPKELKEAIEKIDAEMDRLGTEKEDEEKLFRLEDLKGAIKALQSIKGGIPKEKVFERLAKSKVVELGQLDIHYSGVDLGDIDTAVYQLSVGAYNLSQAKFPEEYEKQMKAQEEATKAEIEAKREKLMKMKVS